MLRERIALIWLPHLPFLLDRSRCSFKSLFSPYSTHLGGGGMKQGREPQRKEDPLDMCPPISQQLLQMSSCCRHYYLLVGTFLLEDQFTVEKSGAEYSSLCSASMSHEINTQNLGNSGILTYKVVVTVSM